MNNRRSAHERMTGIVLGAIIALSLSTVAVPAASAKSVDPARVGDVEATDRTDLTDAERNEIDTTQEQLMDLILEGKSHAEIENEMGLVLVSEPESTIFEPLSSGSDVTVDRPYAYFDTQGNRYVAVAKYRWTPERWDGNPGGPDGFGIAFNQTVTRLGEGARFCDRYGYNCTSGWIESNNSYGVGFAFQDKYVSGKYRGAQGLVTMSFRKNRTGCHQFWSKYGHSWSSTSVTGVSIGSGSVGISFSSSSNRFTVASTTGSLHC